MANSLKSQARKVALWNDRPVVVVMEADKGNPHYHGVMIGPVGMTIETALKTLDKAFAGVVALVDPNGQTVAGAADADDWNYDDVLDAMKAAGFEEILAAFWWEHWALS